MRRAEGESEMTDRARGPKAEDYSVDPGSLGPCRDFRVSMGLREGWDLLLPRSVSG